MDGNITFQTVIGENGKRIRQVLLDGKVIAEDPMETVEIKPAPPEEPAKEENKKPATDEAATDSTNSTIVEKGEKKMSSKVKKGLMIGGGVLGGLALYALGGRRGKADGKAEGYAEGYQEGSQTSNSDSNSEDEAPG